MLLRGAEVAVKLFHVDVFTPRYLKLLRKEVITMRSIESEYEHITFIENC